MERSLRLPRMSARSWWTRSSAASETNEAAIPEATPTADPLRRSSDVAHLFEEEASWVATKVKLVSRLPPVQIFVATAIAIHAIAIFALPLQAWAALETFLVVGNMICAGIAFAYALAAAERALGKRVPVRILCMLFSDVPGYYSWIGGEMIVEPGQIVIPFASWWGVLAQVMVCVPILSSISDILGWALSNRGTMRTRMATIAGVCGATGLLVATWLLMGFHTTEESWEFDLFVAVPSMGAIVIAAMTAVALGAARDALPEAAAATVTALATTKGADGEYRILRPIGAGGMGQVFLAQRIGPHGFQRPVVLKRITPGSCEKPAAVERFLEEARIAASLQHPNVIAVHDLGRFDEGGWFLAMEYLAGLTLRDCAALLVHRQLLAPAEAILAIGEQACRGLGHAHERGVVHRDVSPHNLMLTFEGVVKVLDFGVAKSKTEVSGDGTSRPRRTVVTQAGSLVGKLTYLSPEQFLGRAASPAGDVFGLGVVLYELATGCHPYGRSQGQHPIGEEPGDRVPLATARPDLPNALCAVIDEALAFDPWNRFKNAAEMERALATIRPSVGLHRFDLGDWLKGLAPAHWDDISLDAPVLDTATALHEHQEGTQG